MTKKRSATYGYQIMGAQRTDYVAHMGEMTIWYKMSVIKFDGDVCLTQ
jgi:hypothetical protein